MSLKVGAGGGQRSTAWRAQTERTNEPVNHGSWWENTGKQWGQEGLRWAGLAVKDTDLGRTINCRGDKTRRREKARVLAKAAVESLGYLPKDNPLRQWHDALTPAQKWAAVEFAESKGCRTTEDFINALAKAQGR